MSRPFDLTGTTTVVIGGSAGMGLATAELVAELGGEVVIAARDPQRLSAAALQIAAISGRPVRHRSLSIESSDDVATFISDHGPFDHLVLPGTTVVPVDFEHVTESNAREAFDSKFWGPFCSILASIPHIRAGGSVVMYSGVAAERPVRGFVVGSAINGAINALTRSLALELGPLGVRVNTIAPGAVRTPLWSNIDHLQTPDDIEAAASARLPVGRVGTPRECAELAVALMTNGFMTGEVVGIDGGAKAMR